jgi:hypothetical protein
MLVKEHLLSYVVKLKILPISCSVSTESSSLPPITIRHYQTLAATLPHLIFFFLLPSKKVRPSDNTEVRTYKVSYYYHIWRLRFEEDYQYVSSCHAFCGRVFYAYDGRNQHRETA